MKKISVLHLLAIAGLLQGCADFVQHEQSPTRALLDGSKPLSLSSTTQCQRGIGIVRLYKDTLDGSKIKYNAKFGLTKAAITNEFNVYNLVRENSKQLLKKDELKQAKADIDVDNNSIVIIPADTKGKNLMKASDPTSSKINQPISINYNPKRGYYTNWGTIEDASISDMNTQDQFAGRPQISSLVVKIGDKTSTLLIPDALDSYSHELPLDKKYTATIGEPLVIKITPKNKAADGMLYAQFTNDKEGKDEVTYNYIVTETQGMAEFPIPTKGMKKGEYKLNLFRSEISKIPLDAAGKENFCMELGTGVMGRVSIKEPEKKK